MNRPTERQMRAHLLRAGWVWSNGESWFGWSYGNVWISNNTNTAYRVERKAARLRARRRKR